MNIYRFQFVAECPNDRRHIVYYATIETNRTILAEELVAATTGLRGLQEDIADRLRDQFGGEQRITATHSGVQVETQR